MNHIFMLLCTHGNFLLDAKHCRFYMLGTGFCIFFITVVVLTCMYTIWDSFYPFKTCLIRLGPELALVKS